MSKTAKVIVIGGKKGGVGKSTLAVNIAALLANQGYKVSIMDCDTNRTCKTWIDYRNEYRSSLEENGKPCNIPYIKPEIKDPSQNIRADLIECAKDYDYIIIDTGGYENKAFKSAVVAADMIYIPFAPSDADMQQIVPTLSVIKSLEDNLKALEGEHINIDVRLLLARVTHSSKQEKMEAKELCKDLLSHASLSSALIPEKKKFKTLYGEGLGICDRKPNGSKHEGSACIELLVDEIKGERSVELARVISKEELDA